MHDIFALFLHAIAIIIRLPGVVSSVPLLPNPC
jgi:hypothetical protein